MKLSISNIAWDPALDPDVAAILVSHGMDGVDIAPGKYFGDFAAVSSSDINKVRSWWESRGLALIGMQSLLYGTQGLNVFGHSESQEAMLVHLRRVMQIASGLGITRLTFGSPKNRDRSGLSDEQANGVAHEFFSRLGDMAATFDVLICLEPNPMAYGANFLTNTRDTVDFVSALDHPNIRLQFDSGAMWMNEETPEKVLGLSPRLVGHCHISEPNLSPVGTTHQDHRRLASRLRSVLPDTTVAIEMLTKDEARPLDAIERAVDLVCSEYRGAGSVASEVQTH